jgi:hypothetical protein
MSELGFERGGPRLELRGDAAELLAYRLVRARHGQAEALRRLGAEFAGAQLLWEQGGAETARAHHHVRLESDNLDSRQN